MPRPLVVKEGNEGKIPGPGAEPMTRPKIGPTIVPRIGFPFGVKTPVGPLEGPGPKITWPGGKTADPLDPFPMDHPPGFNYPNDLIIKENLLKEIIRVFEPTIVIGSYAIRKIHETIIREIILFLDPNPGPGGGGVGLVWFTQPWRPFFGRVGIFWRGTEEIALTQVRI